MGSPLGVIFVAVLAVLGGARAIGAVARSRARWVRYLRACPPSRLSGLPSQMITGSQRRRRRVRAREEQLRRSAARSLPTQDASSLPLPEPEWVAPAEPIQGAPPVPQLPVLEEETVAELERDR